MTPEHAVHAVRTACTQLPPQLQQRRAAAETHLPGRTQSRRPALGTPPPRCQPAAPGSQQCTASMGSRLLLLGTAKPGQLSGNAALAACALPLIRTCRLSLHSRPSSSRFGMVRRPDTSCCQAAGNERRARRRALCRSGMQPQATATLNRLRQLLGATTSSRAAVTSSRACAACRAGRVGGRWRVGRAVLGDVRAVNVAGCSGAGRQRGWHSTCHHVIYTLQPALKVRRSSNMDSQLPPAAALRPHLRERREVDALCEALAQAGGAKHRLLQLRQRLHALLAGLARELVLGGLQLLRAKAGTACFRAAAGAGRRAGEPSPRPCRGSQRHGFIPVTSGNERCGRALTARAAPTRVVSAPGQGPGARQWLFRGTRRLHNRVLHRSGCPEGLRQGRKARVVGRRARLLRRRGVPAARFCALPPLQQPTAAIQAACR